jgi:Mce-associated membrane protein
MTTVDDDSTETVPKRRWSGTLLLTAIALVVAAALVAVWFGVAWVKAGSDDSLGRAKVRDEVDRVARAAIVTFNTIDYRKADEGLNSWEAASTGPLHDEVVGRRSSGKQAIEAAKNVTTANVLSLAVTELNEFDGTATVIAALHVTITPEGKEPVPKYQRVQGALQRTGDGWKLANLAYVDPAN